MMSPIAFIGGGGFTGCAAKNEGMKLSAPDPGAPCISISRPWLMKLTACTAPQSEVTKPLNPISSRRMRVRVESLPQAKVPLTRLYEHMMDDPPALMAASKGAT